jgi:sulfur dioxygenase
MSGTLQWWGPPLALVLMAGCASPRPGGAVAETPGAGAEAVPGARVGHLRAAEVRGFLGAHPDALVLDVRNPDEWNDDLGHIDGARQIPLPELDHRLVEIEAWKDRPVVAVCRVGARSARAADALAAAGFRQVFNLDGGMAAYRRAGN